MFKTESPPHFYTAKKRFVKQLVTAGKYISMGRKKTPTNILEMKGSFKNHPERKNESEPEVENTHDWSNAPGKFTPAQCQAWHDIVRQVPAGVLSDSDQIHVELTAKALAQLRISPEVNSALLGRFQAMAAALGLSPSSRASLSVAKPKANKFSDL